MQGLALSVPIDIYRFNPGGSTVTSVCISVVEEGRDEPTMITDAARLISNETVKNKFREYHTREMQRSFKNKLDNLAIGKAGLVIIIRCSVMQVQLYVYFVSVIHLCSVSSRQKLHIQGVSIGCLSIG